MSRLTPDECRVLGVLVEKALTTPAQYPLSLNALISGANQKSNREPVLNLSEDRVLAALDGLRMKNLAREVMLSGSRVAKYRHIARETMDVSTSELVILTELLLRGPQTVGELRGRASRMHPLESIEVVTNVLEHLAAREEPYVQSLPPAPGSRANRYAQLLCPELHPLDAAPASAAPMEAAPIDHDLAERVRRLEEDVEELKQTVARLTEAAHAAEPAPGERV
jgi:uncharacterized protein YceH (UPF0502 family)